MPRRVQSTCSPRVELSILVGSGFAFQESSVWLLVPRDGGTTVGSGFLGLLQCPGRKFLLELEGAFSRLATRSSSHRHGGELRLEIVYRQRDCPFLWDFSSLSENLAG